MVGIDSSVLSMFLFPAASAPYDFRTKQPIEHARERVEFLIAELQDQKETILIPTPVLSEVLVVAPNIDKTIQILQGTGCFKIAGFGERAAVEIAIRLQVALKSGSKSEGILAPWQKLKYDRQIVAICKVEGCSCIYSADVDIHTHGGLWRIPVLNISDVRLGGQIKLNLETSNDESEEQGHSDTRQRVAKEEDPQAKIAAQGGTLPEQIAALCTAGKLPAQFGTEHIREHLSGEFADNYLNVVLANYCESTGDYVKKGQRAWFRRVSEGRYELL